MLEQWQDNAQRNQSFNVSEAMFHHTLYIIGQALFSIDRSNETNSASRAFMTVNKRLTNYFFLPFAPLGVPKRSAGRPRYAYFPFGGEPHLCIGNNFAMVEAQRYRLHLIPGYKVRPKIALTLQPGDGLPMALQERVEIR